MPAPLLYEVNTRSWLRELSERSGEVITLENVPDAEINRWKELGFTHVWLMGIWTVGPLARKEALKHWREHWSKRIPSLESDVHGSPYAIQEYSIDSRLGTPITLLLLRERLRMAGIKLIVDFIPNHFGLDSNEPFQHPGRFVQGARGSPGTFDRLTRFGMRHFAHGRDPHFPPWSDTVQVDYRTHDTHEAMSAILQTLAACSDGVRCDMAMLPLPEVFRDTWREFPPTSANPATANFWRHSIAAFRRINPGADLIAEVYWGREEELQEYGFDFTYNKRVTDFILKRDFRGLQEFLLSRPVEYLKKSIHFLENHDEERIAAVLPKELHEAAAVLIMGLPGMPLLHEGQMEGRREFARIQMSKRASEPVDRGIHDFYQRLLTALADTNIRRGDGEVLKPVGGHGVEEVIAIHWTGNSGGADLVVVNPGKVHAQFLLKIEANKPQVLFTTTPEIRARVEEATLRLEMPPESAQILRISRE